MNNFFRNGILIALLISFSIGTHARNAVWSDPISLWRDVAVKSPFSERGNYNLANELKKRGEYNEAIRYYLISIALKGDEAKVYNNLGTALAALGWNEQAIEQYQMAINLDPDFAEAHFNLAAMLVSYGDTVNSRVELIKTLQINPNHQQAKQFLIYLDKDSTKQ